MNEVIQNDEELLVAGLLSEPIGDTLGHLKNVRATGLLPDDFVNERARAAYSVILGNNETEEFPTHYEALRSRVGIEYAQNILLLSDAVSSLVEVVCRARRVTSLGRRRRFLEALNRVPQNVTPDYFRKAVEEALKAVGFTDSDSGVGLKSLSDLMQKPLEPLDPIVAGCFERGDKIDLIAPSKCRKSFFVLDLALHVALGRDFLGLTIPKSRKVVYVNLEIKDEWIKRRLSARLKGYDLTSEEIGDKLMILNARGRGAWFRDEGYKLVLENMPDLTIIDPRYKLMKPGENENAGEGLCGVLDLFDKLASAGMAVLVVSHDAKGDVSLRDVRDRGAGSSWAARDADCRFTLTPHKEDPQNMAILEVMARNYPPRESVTIAAETDRWVLRSEVPAIAYTRAPRTKKAHIPAVSPQDIVTFVSKQPAPMRKMALMEEIALDRHSSEAAVERALKKALVLNLLVERQEHVKGGGKLICLP